MRIFQVVEVLLLFLIPIMHRAQTEHCRAWEMPWQILYQTSGVARNLIWGMGVYFLISHCNFKTSVNVPHVNKTVTNFLGYIYRYTPRRYASVTDGKVSQSIINSAAFTKQISVIFCYLFIYRARISILGGCFIFQFFLFTLLNNIWLLTE